MINSRLRFGSVAVYATDEDKGNGVNPFRVRIVTTRDPKNGALMETAEKGEPLPLHPTEYVMLTTLSELPGISERPFDPHTIFEKNDVFISQRAEWLTNLHVMHPDRIDYLSNRKFRNL